MPSSDTSSTPARELPAHVASLVQGIGEGRRVALARAISMVENERAGFQDLLHALLAEERPGATRVGITGPPGAGKSSLVSALAGLALGRDETVGVVAVDPTSPYSGGALLGDRIRMNELATDPGIFIRSMASRGSLGGLATTTKEVLDVMDAFGFPRLLVETVGVGQTELEITGATDTVVVVLVPESGDGIQAMKAGLMEIADVFVVNKADRPGADRLVREIRSALRLRTGKGGGGGAGHHGPSGHHGPATGSGRGSATGAGRGSATGAGRGSGRGSAAGSGPGSAAAARRDSAGADAEEPDADWTPPVLLTMAHAGEGVEELLDTVDRHRAWLVHSGELVRRRRARTADRIRDVLDRELKRRVRRQLADEQALAAALARIAEEGATPYSEAAGFLRGLGVDPEEAPLPRPSVPPGPGGPSDTSSND